jgi:hypothetical protein
MRRLVRFLIFCFVIPGCRDDQNKNTMTRVADDHYEKIDTASFPLIIEGGTKIVYQYGHLTADKGLKLYFDTIPYPAGGLRLDDSVRRKLSVK